MSRDFAATTGNNIWFLEQGEDFREYERDGEKDPPSGETALLEQCGGVEKLDPRVDGGDAGDGQNCRGLGEGRNVSRG